MTELGPLFLAGIDRCGIGLVGELLEEHPSIAVTRRINFWSFYYNRYGDLSRPENFDRCLADMMRYTRISRLQPQPDRLRRDFQEGEQSYSRLLALLQEQNMRRLGKTRWADKSLNSERDAGLIFEAFPSARMIHVLRDPRDRYASQRGHRGMRRGKVGGGAALWRWSARLAERNVRQFAGRYKIVRYEDLVAGPEAFLRDLCQFIGEPYAPEMLTTAGEDDRRAPREIWTTSVGRFRQDLSAREIAFMDFALSRQMPDFDYRPEPQQLAIPASLRFYALDCPLNLTRMVLADFQSDLRDRAGRKPSDRRLSQPPANSEGLAAHG